MVDRVEIRAAFCDFAVIARLLAGYGSDTKLASAAIGRIERALQAGFRSRDAKVSVWANESDYKSLIRLYVVSDYFKGMPEKKRLDTVYAVLESGGARELVKKISLCIGITWREYDKDFGGGVWIKNIEPSRPNGREAKGRRKASGLAKTSSRN